MTDPPYKVSDSREAVRLFRAAIEAARANGDAEAAVLGAEWIMHELAHNPHEFGESREEVSSLRLAVRIGFAGQMHVIFGVHEPSRTVFVRKLGYSPRRS